MLIKNFSDSYSFGVSCLSRSGFVNLIDICIALYYIYYCISILLDENITLHIQLEVVSIAGHAEESIFIFPGFKLLELKDAYFNVSPPVKHMIQFKREIELEDLTKVRMDVMPGFRLRWHYTSNNGTELDKETQKGKFVRGLVDSTKVNSDKYVRKVTIKYRVPQKCAPIVYKPSAFRYTEKNVRGLALLVAAEDRKDAENINIDDLRLSAHLSEPSDQEDDPLNSDF